jgi:hypothetical protein
MKCLLSSLKLFMLLLCSLAHPYLLADNRHYTFYLWKDVIQHNQSAKYCLIPLYVYSWWSILHSLGEIPPSCCRILVSPNQLSLLLKLLQSFLCLLGLGLPLFPLFIDLCRMWELYNLIIKSSLIYIQGSLNRRYGEVQYLWRLLHQWSL